MRSTTKPSVSSEMRLVRNELLCYAFSHVHNSTARSLSDCLADFYHPSEIHAARDILWKEYDKTLTSTGARKPRRTLAPVDKQTALPFAEDIASWVGAIVNCTPSAADGQDDAMMQF